MKNKDKIILADFKGFIDWSIKNNTSLVYVLANLAHDIGGILKKDKCFSPRTGGYRELSKMK
jgi:hypothetical protein